MRPSGHDQASLPHAGRERGYEGVHWRDVDRIARSKDYMGRQDIPLSWCKVCGLRIEFCNDCWWVMGTCSSVCGEGEHIPDGLPMAGLPNLHDPADLERWLDG